MGDDTKLRVAVLDYLVEKGFSVDHEGGSLYTIRRGSQILSQDLPRELHAKHLQRIAAKLGVQIHELFRTQRKAKAAGSGSR